MRLNLDQKVIIGMIVVTGLFIFALFGCATNSTTGKKEIDPGKAASFLEYAQMFNGGLSATASIIALVAPDPAVKAGALAAQPAIPRRTKLAAL